MSAPNFPSQMLRLLDFLSKAGGTNLYLRDGVPIWLTVQGTWRAITTQPLKPDNARQLIQEVLSDAQSTELETTGDLNISIQRNGSGYRISAYKQQGSVAVVIRHIPNAIPPLEGISNFEVLRDLSCAPRGLVLVVGSSGAGKSTTLASMIDFRNRNNAGHILCIEDPIEFVHQPKQSFITQRELSADVPSLDVALRNASRQAPDCLLIGEIRDKGSMTAALSQALAGSLVVASLPANNAEHAINRILSFFPSENHPSLLQDLSACLRAVVAQRLVKPKEGIARILVQEILVNAGLIQSTLASGKLADLRASMRRSMTDGSRTFEVELAALVKKKLISRQEAINACSNVNELLYALENEPTSKERAPVVTNDSEMGTTYDGFDIASPLIATPLMPPAPTRKVRHL